LKKPLIIVVVLLVVVVGVLIATRPDRASFLTRIDNQVVEGSDNFFEKISSEIAAKHIKNNVVFHDYVLFTMVKVKHGKDYETYIGALGNWW